MKKKLLTITMLFMLSISLFACGKQTDTSQASNDSQTSIVDDVKEAVEIMTDSDEENDKDSQTPLPESLSGSNLFVRDDIAYYIGMDQIMSMNRSSGDSKVIWTNKDVVKNQYLLSGGKGILLGNYIYFFRNVPDSENVNEYSSSNYLCQISLDSLDYKEIAKYAADNYCTGSMYFNDGMLFVDGDGVKDCYRLDEKGDITDTVSRVNVESYTKLPEGYSLVSYNNNGYQLFFPERTIQNTNHLILQNTDFDYVNYDLSNGREMALGGYIASANDNKLLIQEYHDDYQIYGTLDIKSGEYNFLTKNETSYNIYAMDDKYAYFEEEDELTRGNVSFMRINLTNGKIDEHYSTKASDSSLNVYPTYCFPTVFDGEYIYTVGSENYALYLKAINVADKTEILSKDAFYDTDISKVGKLIHKSDSLTADNGDLLARANLYTLHVNDEFAGAEKINELMEEEANEMLASLEGIKDEVTEWYDMASADENGYFAPYDYSMNISNIKYFDGNLLSFDVERYDYLGGAHGMPYNEGFTFDVNTGERLSLGDLVTLSEEEMKDIITSHFLKMIEENGTDYYWEDAGTTVHEMFDMNSNSFYLTNDGIYFYCMPYDIASYAQGFQSVTIPYSELGIDIK